MEGLLVRRLRWQGGGNTLQGDLGSSVPLDFDPLTHIDIEYHQHGNETALPATKSLGSRCVGNNPGSGEWLWQANCGKLPSVAKPARLSISPQLKALPLTQDAHARTSQASLYLSRTETGVLKNVRYCQV